MLHKMICYLMLCSITMFHSISSAGDWSYSKSDTYYPGKWSNFNIICGGPRQSPINFDAYKNVYDKNLKAVVATASKTNNNYTIKNKGYTLSLGLPDNAGTITFGTDGDLVPIEIHWHWGSDNTKGSEHTLNNFHYVMEGHIVCYNSKFYNNSKDAVSSPSGLYVIGILYKIGNENAVLKKVLAKLPPTSTTNDLFYLDSISFTDFLPQNVAKYYRYEGSLTTPPCTENVIWTVMDTPIEISSDQMNEFRKFNFSKHGTGKMMDNFRPTLTKEVRSDYIERVVYTSFNKSSVKLNCELINFVMLIGCVLKVSLFN